MSQISVDMTGPKTFLTFHSSRSVLVRLYSVLNELNPHNTERLVQDQVFCCSNIDHTLGGLMKF